MAYPPRLTKHRGHRIVPEMADSSRAQEPTTHACQQSRAKITNACLGCRQKKRRCPGGQPCPPCTTSNLPCTYTEDQDRRRKVYSEKARSDIEFHKRLLDGLLCAIRDGNCSEIFDMVRANASTQEIAAQLDSQTCDEELVCPERYMNEACNTSERSRNQSDKLQSLTVLATDPPVLQDETGFHSSATAKEGQRRLPPFNELMALISDRK